ncbi:MAG: hypothetical protein B7Z24_08065, partial [Pseudomonadales bacterium 32-42-5]
ANTPKRWNGSAWVVVTDKVATDALAAANAASSLAATKADSSALTALDSKVTNVDGKVSTNASNITTLQGKVTTVENGLATKANASALNDIYTKTQTDAKAAEIAAGQIATYNANLVIGGVNQLLNSEGERSSTATTQREYLLYERSSHLMEFYNEHLGKDITISFDLKVDVAGYVKIYSSNGSAHSYDAGISVATADVGEWKRYSVTVKPKTHTTSTTVSTLEFYGTYDTGRIPHVRKVQLEAGNTATDWSPSPRDTQAALDANATAIDNTNSEVTRVDGRVTTEANRITSLSGRVSTVEGQVTTKAEAAALSSTAVDGRVTATNSNVTSLTGRVDTVEGNLTTKADVSAVNALTTRVGNVEGGLSTQANNTTALEAKLNVSGKGGTNLLFKSNKFGSYNGAAYPHVVYQMGEDWEVGATYTLMFCVEHKRGTGDSNSVLSAYVGGGNQTVRGVVNTGGKTVQTVTFVKGSAGTAKAVHFFMLNRPTADKASVGDVYWAVLVKGSVLTTDEWVPSPYEHMEDSAANASAISSTNTEVSRINGVVSGHTTQLSNLTASIAGKADTSALNALTVRVADEE